MASIDEEKAARTDDPTETKDPDAKINKFAAWLNYIFITSCVLGVFLDPLFLFIPLLNQDLKCLRLDNTLKIWALVSRSFTDLFYLGRIIFQVARFENCSPFISRFLPEKSSCCPTFMTSLFKSVHDSLPGVSHVIPKPSITKEILGSYIIVDILAILPLPQVAILHFFPKMTVSRSFRMFIMNFLVMVQYVPRVLRIYLSCKKARKPFKGHISLWVKGLLNFFLYILASHVLGAVWYFFAAQQMISCWEQACRYGNGCDATTFYCHDHQTLRNVTPLNDLCPINPPNIALFDFGIYLNVLQSGALWSTNYILKFSNSFCWGLRNLSSLASNLQPSFYTWEILFVASISIIGLLLFVYLIGNLQTYVQLGTQRLETERRKMRFEEKMRDKVDPDVGNWLSKIGIPLSRKKDIVEKIGKELQENPDLDVLKEIISILPEEYIKKCCPLSRLKNLPLLKDMDEGVLREISEKLKPEKYTRGQIIIEKDKTLEKMLFIVDGRVKIEKTDGYWPELDTGKFYGEELLVSPTWTSSGDAKPINDESVEALDDVQALVLYATDMSTLGSGSKRSITELRLVVTILPKVPKLQTMDEHVLKAMSKLHSQKRYKRNDCIVREGQPLNMMFFVTSGKVTKNENHTEEIFFGEELVEWVLDEFFPTILPLSTCTVRVESNDARVLILKADHRLKSVASKFEPQFKRIASPSDVRLTWLKKVEIFQQKDEQVLNAISKRLIPMNFNVAKRYILQEKKPLKMIFFVIRGVVLIESDSAMDVNVTKTCELGSFYGEELVHWVTTWVSHQSFPKLPLSPGSALCGVFGGPVQILALTAEDLKSVVSEFKSKFTTETTLPTDSDQPQDRLTILKNVERLETMDEEVLKKICGYLELRTYEDAYIIQKDKPIEMTFFIMSGVVSVTDGSSKHYRNEGGRPNHSGDDLIEHWLQSKSTSVPAQLPTSPFSFCAIGEVEVLVLKADDLAKVQPGDHIR